MEYRLDSHTHTLASGHAYNTIMEMARAAADKGLSLLGITEHSLKMPGTCKEVYFLNLKAVPRRICGIEVLFGAELNIIDYTGKVDLREAILKTLDVNVASLHPPCINPGSMEENTAAVIGAIENPYVNIIGHPDDGRYLLDYDQIAAAAAGNRVLLEINNHSLDPCSSRENARENDLRMLEYCKKYRTHIILNSDAHWCDEIGNCEYSLPLIEEADFPEELIVNRDVELYRSFLRKYRE